MPVSNNMITLLDDVYKSRISHYVIYDWNQNRELVVCILINFIFFKKIEGCSFINFTPGRSITYPEQYFVVKRKKHGGCRSLHVSQTMQTPSLVFERGAGCRLINA